MEAFENKTVVGPRPVNLSSGSVAKSPLDILIEELEAGTWERVVLCPKQTQNALDNALAACGSPHCAGCYEVDGGRRIHPPKCGEYFLRWRAWLEGKGLRH